MRTYCAKCGRAFQAAKSYYYLCTPCWRRDAGLSRATPRDEWREGYEVGRAVGRNEILAARTARAPQFDDGLLIDIIKLVHPDKHPPERFTEANAVTARVNALREAVAR